MDSKFLPLLKLMLLSREADLREAMLIRQGKAHCHVSSSGHEALMAVTYQLQREDYLYPYYRGSHLMMGKGLSRKSIASDFFAKQTSSSKGRSSSQHANSRLLNIFPTSASTASQCTPAVGTAWGQKLSKTNTITVCSIGDGATREGDFYEALCFAIQNQLPIIFLIEDNQYAISTSTKNMMPFRMGIFNELIFTKIDGYNVFQVWDSAQSIINQVRSGHGPAVLWCELDRLQSHTASDNHALYRPQDELENLKDPINFIAEALIAKQLITVDAYKEMQKEAKLEIANIYKSAQNEPEPVETNLQDHLYAPPSAEYPLLPDIFYQNDITMVQGLNQILAYGLTYFPNMLLFGQDIEDPKGGAFNFTKGLSTQFPDRVTNAPIAESTIIGSAVGLSVLGFKPVFEIQFIDFITPGFDQLVTQVSSLRWRTCSEWKCPLVLYAPYGAYLPAGGLWHSQSNDGWWAHIPGIRVAIPSTPQDIIELFWAAFHDEDPSLILIPKHIFRKKASINSREILAFGKAKIRITGQDVTVVSWGNTVELAEQAAIKLKKENIAVEVIDLRTLVPCDWDTLESSLAKTGRLVVVHEDNKTCGFGASVVAEMVTNPRCFNYLYASPQIVARQDIHIPYHPKLEAFALPNVESICEAIYITLNH
ncbi:alpha-ketoacid dehydrogenase subunit alpha/beta [Legionella septentrionalis]|uniref:alpha-ketoacid dehydrogenase subunit alpha/beta n=1 Tax=Legionella septentrionalis TaxID=2498109 RepID=UPI000F8CC35C|nr:alpha-ketoacid dehydrogenase subunit alpha/beta [Legionella septentrionalis]RUQ94629.1 2-oxoisovalerate dehydrogenase [Legionella septentrionalis]